MEQATNGNLALVKREQSAIESLDWDTEENRQMIREMYGGSGIPERDWQLFLAHARAVRLSPLTRQIQPICFDKKWIPYTTIHGLVATACRSKVYAGADQVEFDCKPKGDALNGQHPNWARATVYKIVQGARVAFTAEVYWVERNKGQASWLKQPWSQLGKCAMAAVIRLGWEEAADLYIEEELGIEDGKVVESLPVKPPRVVTPPPVGQEPPFAPPAGKTWQVWCADLAKQLGIFGSKDDYLAFVKEITGIDANLKKIPDAGWQKFAHQLLQMISEAAETTDAEGSASVKVEAEAAE